MPWRNVQMLDLEAAMNECDQTTLDQFRARYGGFRPARNLYMYLGGRGPYEARPLLAAAYFFRHGNRIGPEAFTNNDGHDFLINLGFRVVEIE